MGRGRLERAGGGVDRDRKPEGARRGEGRRSGDDRVRGPSFLRRGGVPTKTAADARPGGAASPRQTALVVLSAPARPVEGPQAFGSLVAKNERRRTSVFSSRVNVGAE
jgi:hypothetical protein